MPKKMKSRAGMKAPGGAGGSGSPVSGGTPGRKVGRKPMRVGKPGGAPKKPKRVGVKPGRPKPGGPKRRLRRPTKKAAAKPRAPRGRGTRRR